MADDTPALEDMLRGALRAIDDEDVRLFLGYFDDLKRQARTLLRGKARTFPGDSAVAQSALLSLLADVSVQHIPLADVDEEGRPAFWPLLLRYIERHCNKWNKYYRAKKRRGAELSLSTGTESMPALEPAAAQPTPDEEMALAEAWEALERKLTPRQQHVAALAAQGKTLEEIAEMVGCSEATVSNDKRAIRNLLEGA
jgi:RNA polymerase sigma factor (sigma-70 family)